eukprot:scaffold132514_cov19-Tisochrysis_lutea.AAC.1
MYEDRSNTGQTSRTPGKRDMPPGLLRRAAAVPSRRMTTTMSPRPHPHPLRQNLPLALALQAPRKMLLRVRLSGGLMSSIRSPRVHNSVPTGFAFLVWAHGAPTEVLNVGQWQPCACGKMLWVRHGSGNQVDLCVPLEEALMGNHGCANPEHAFVSQQIRAGGALFYIASLPPACLCEEFRMVGLCTVQVREHVRAVKTQLLLGLRVLRDVAAGNPRFAATKLEELRELCQPLLSSKLVGEFHGAARWFSASSWVSSAELRGLSSTLVGDTSELSWSVFCAPQAETATKMSSDGAGISTFAPKSPIP